MDFQREEMRAARSSEWPPKARNRQDGNRGGRSLSDVQGLREHIARHPPDYYSRPRLALGLLRLGFLHPGIDELKAAICVADGEINARFLQPCGLIEHGQLSEAVCLLREASSIRLHRAKIRYALETTYYDHSLVDLAMDEWRVSLGFRRDGGAERPIKGLDQAPLLGFAEVVLRPANTGEETPTGRRG